MTSEATSGVLVYMRHIRAAKICAKGAIEWFAHQNIDIRRLKDGLPVEVLEATGDKMALDVARIAREDHDG